MEFTVSKPDQLNLSDMTAACATLVEYCQAMNLRTIPAPLARNEDGTYDFAALSKMVHHLANEGIRPACISSFPGPTSVPIARERFEEDSGRRRDANERAAQDIARIAETGIDTIVNWCFLPRGEDPTARQRSWEIMLEAFEVMTAAAEKVGVYLAAHSIPDSALHGFAEQKTLVETIRSARLGICYDPIYTSLNGLTVEERGDYLTPLDLLNGRLTYAHIRNQVWSEQAGKPVHVFLGEGVVDELAVLRKLSEVGYTGVLQVEHVPGGDMGNALALGYLRGLARAGLVGR